MRNGRVESRKEGRVVVVSRPAAASRLDQLQTKPNRTQPETLELINLRLQEIQENQAKIMAHLGIK